MKTCMDLKSTIGVERVYSFKNGVKIGDHIIL